MIFTLIIIDVVLGIVITVGDVMAYMILAYILFDLFKDIFEDRK